MRNKKLICCGLTDVIIIVSWACILFHDARRREAPEGE